MNEPSTEDRSASPPATPETVDPGDQDLQLCRAAHGGDELAADRLAVRLACVPAMLHRINGLLGGHLSESDVHDASQEVLVSMWRKLGRFRGGVRLESWAYGFCVTQVRRCVQVRARRPTIPLGESQDEIESREGDAEKRALELEWVAEEISSLGSPAREVIQLKHYEELTFEEIGKRLNVPANTAKTHYYRCLSKLRMRLASRHAEEWND